MSNVTEVLLYGKKYENKMYYENKQITAELK